MTFIQKETIDQTIQSMVKQYGEDQHARIEKGVNQVAGLWKESDGSAEDFTAFCLNNFIADDAKLKETFARYDRNLESINGHFTEINRDLSEPMQLDIGPMLPVDYQFANYSPWSHLSEDLFETKIAFSALLNFPMTTLQEKLDAGNSWSRMQWAETRLADQFAERVPAPVNQKIAEAYVQAETYISEYNIPMHHVLTSDGRSLFPEGMNLISHWGLRDELKAHYPDPDGLEKQELIKIIMEKIIRQEIPEQVINNPDVDWQPADNSVQITTAEGAENKSASVDQAPEPDTRYQMLLDIFKAEKASDPYYANAKTLMDRQFNLNREIPESKVEELFMSVLTSEQMKKTAQLIEKRLGRKLRPFDIWYDGFKSRGSYSEADLDKIVAEKYPTYEDFDKDIPNILKNLDFDAETAEFLGSKIVVDPARGSGHAQGAARREDNAHLRTRVPKGGMNYKGYNIACHELGHNCEQVISLNKIDYVMLNGVPNNAFTEAFAFVFQARDLELLGFKDENPLNDHMKTLDRFWSVCEIGAVSLVDIRVWHWMYDHPDATASELKAAVIDISKDVWNTYMAPVYGMQDEIILGIYSHMIAYGLYLPDYPLGFIIQNQIENYLKGKKLGVEMERMCKLGSITPDAWMVQAVGQPISTEPLLESVDEALKELQGKR